MMPTRGTTALVALAALGLVSGAGLRALTETAASGSPADRPDPLGADTAGDERDQPDAPAQSLEPTVPPTVTVEATVAPEPSITVAAPTTVATRIATLYSDYAVVRVAPDLGAERVAVLQGERGSLLTLAGPHQAGWYEITAPISGFLFGTFVLPADDGLMVSETSSGLDAVLLDSSGARLSLANPSGDKVLVTDSSKPLWEVLLPDGRTAYVDSSLHRLAS